MIYGLFIVGSSGRAFRLCPCTFGSADSAFAAIRPNSLHRIAIAEAEERVGESVSWVEAREIVEGGA